MKELSLRLKAGDSEAWSAQQSSGNGCLSTVTVTRNQRWGRELLVQPPLLSTAAPLLDYRRRGGEVFSNRTSGEGEVSPVTYTGSSSRSSPQSLPFHPSSNDNRGKVAKMVTMLVGHRGKSWSLMILTERGEKQGWKWRWWCEVIGQRHPLQEDRLTVTIRTLLMKMMLTKGAATAEEMIEMRAN